MGNIIDLATYKLIKNLRAQNEILKRAIAIYDTTGSKTKLKEFLKAQNIEL